MTRQRVSATGRLSRSSAPLANNRTAMPSVCSENASEARIAGSSSTMMTTDRDADSCCSVTKACQGFPDDQLARSEKRGIDIAQLRGALFRRGGAQQAGEQCHAHQVGKASRFHLGHHIGAIDLDRARADAEIEG